MALPDYGFVADEDVKESLAALLKNDSTDGLEPYWDDIVKQSNASAFQDVVSALTVRGYSSDQIEAWTRGAEFQRDIALYWSLVKGGALHNYDDKFIDKLDRREELEDALVIEGGVVITPDDSSGQVGHGTTGSSDDVFSMGMRW